MSWALARTQMVTIMTGISSLTTSRGLPAKLSYSKEANLESLPGSSRVFWIDVDRASDYRLLRQGGATWERVRAVPRIFYKRDVDHEALVDAIMQDRRAISLRFLDDAYWGRPTSTITKIGDGKGIEAEIVPVTGGQLLTLSVPIDFT